MHPKRGRKINDSLPPTRARDNSRAFRARQTAHLQALEQRISELEAENDCFRQVYGYPPSNRPPLGRGPTGLQFPSACSRDVIATPVTEPGGRNDSQLLLNHQSPMPGSNFTQSRSSTSGPSLQSGPFLPTDPSTCSCDVPVMEPSGRNDPQLILSSHWFPMPSDIYLSSPNTTFVQFPDGPIIIDDHSGGHNSPLHDGIRDADEISQLEHMVYTRPYQHNANMSSQNHPTFSKLEMSKNGREFLGFKSKSKF